MCQDLNQILEGWDYNSNEITVRKIVGVDGKEKVQMRVALGVFQMEMTGRPDGKKPFGFESLLEYFFNRLEQHTIKYGSSEGFYLDSAMCIELRQEALQYYYRYLSLFIIGEYEYVVRDTIRNLKLFDFIKRYARDDVDKLSLEQYRPYVIMMNSRAKAYLAMKGDDYTLAEEIIENAMSEIEEFYISAGQPEYIQGSYELGLLRELKREVTDTMPMNYIAKLKVELQKAVGREDFEKAAHLRDQIKKIENHNSHQ